MSFFWPSHVGSSPGFRGRLGRLIHWVAAAYLIGIAIFIASFQAGDGPDVTIGKVAMIAAFLPLYLLGRGFRYLLAGE